MPAEAVQSVLRGCVTHAILMEFRRTKRSVWFQARGQMDTQNAPGINQTHTRVCCFIVWFVMLQPSIWKKAGVQPSVQMIFFFFAPSLLPMTDFVTIKSNQYLISNIVLSLPVSFLKAETCTNKGWQTDVTFEGWEEKRLNGLK